MIRQKLSVSVLSALAGLAALSGHAQVVWYSGSSFSDSDSYLGVSLEDVTADSVKELDLPAERGVICREVVADAPAESAGLLADDVIIDFNGTRVESARQLQRLVAETPVGRTVTLEVIRAGETRQLEATVGRREAAAPDFGDLFRNFPEPPRDQAPWTPWQPPFGRRDQDPRPRMFEPPRLRLGISMQPISGQLAGFFGLTDGESGVLVESVVADSTAEAAGVKAGDVITQVDGAAVNTPADVQSRIREAEGLVDLTIVRDRAVIHVPVNLAGRDDAPARDEAAADDELKEEISFPPGAM